MQSIQKGIVVNGLTYQEDHSYLFIPKIKENNDQKSCLGQLIIALIY